MFEYLKNETIMNTGFEVRESPPLVFQLFLVRQENSKIFSLKENFVIFLRYFTKFFSFIIVINYIKS